MWPEHQDAKSEIPQHLQFVRIVAIVMAILSTLLAFYIQLGHSFILHGSSRQFKWATLIINFGSLRINIYGWPILFLLLFSAGFLDMISAKPHDDLIILYFIILIASIRTSIYFEIGNHYYSYLKFVLLSFCAIAAGYYYNAKVKKEEYPPSDIAVFLFKIIKILIIFTLLVYVLLFILILIVSIFSGPEL